MGDGREVYRILVGKSQLESPRRRWKDGFRMDLREIGWAVRSGFIWLRINTGDRLS
jgi:hypothetical protein